MFHLADWLNVLPLCYLMLNQLVDWVLKEVLYGPHLPIETSKMNKLYSFERYELHVELERYQDYMYPFM